MDKQSKKLWLAYGRLVCLDSYVTPQTFNNGAAVKEFRGSS